MDKKILNTKPSVSATFRCRARRCCALSIFLVCLLFSLSARAGKLEDISDTVGNDDEKDDDGVTFCFFCFMGNEEDEDASYESNTGPGVQQDSAFLQYPYARSSDGYAVVHRRYYEMVKDSETGAYEKKMTRERTTPTDLTLEDGKSTAFMARLGYWYDLDNVHLSDLRLGVDAAGVAGVQFRWTEFYEKVPAEEDSGTGTTTSNGEKNLETIALLDLMARVPVVTEHRGLFRVGVAGLLMHDKKGTNAGGFLAAEVALFPVRPLILAMDLHLGYINKAVYIRSEASVGAIMGPLELFGGYQAQLFLGEHTSVVSHGPGGGLRIWF